MPTTFRFIVILAFLAMVAYGVMFALAALVKPEQVEMRIPIPAERVNPDPGQPAQGE